LRYCGDTSNSKVYPNEPVAYIRRPKGRGFTPQRVTDLMPSSGFGSLTTGIGGASGDNPPPGPACAAWLGAPLGTLMAARACSSFRPRRLLAVGDGPVLDNTPWSDRSRVGLRAEISENCCSAAGVLNCSYGCINSVSGIWLR
jgi:hypothetical protein